MLWKSKELLWLSITKLNLKKKVIKRHELTDWSLHLKVRGIRLTSLSIRIRFHIGDRINIREYRRGNQKRTIQRNWQYRVHRNLWSIMLESSMFRILLQQRVCPLICCYKPILHTERDERRIYKTKDCATRTLLQNRVLPRCSKSVASSRSTNVK